MSFFSGPRHGGARGSCGAPQKFGPLSPGRSRSLPRAVSLGGQRKTPVARILGLAWLRLTKILRVNFLVELAEERVLKLKFVSLIFAVSVNVVNSSAQCLNLS